MVKKPIRFGIAVAAGVVLLSGCTGGDLAGDARREAEQSVSMGVDQLAKSFAETISSEGIGEQLTADAISRIGVPVMPDPDRVPSPAPYAPGVGTAVILSTSGTGRATQFRF